MKFLIFHISKAWKTDPFRVEPSCIGNYREYPPVLYGVTCACIAHAEKKTPMAPTFSYHMVIH